MKQITQTLCRTQSGFTLIEALVTFLILSIGLLGLAGLQTKALQFDHSAYQRTQAALLASDIIDRMHANITAARASRYDAAYGTDVTSTVDCFTAACSTTDMSQYDLTQWKDALALTLPRGDGSITTAAGTGSTFNITVTVYWDELRNGSTATTCGAPSTGDLNCFRMVVAI